MALLHYHQSEVDEHPYWAGFLDEYAQDPDQTGIYDTVINQMRIKEEDAMMEENLEGEDIKMEEDVEDVKMESLEEAVRRLQEENDALRAASIPSPDVQRDANRNPQQRNRCYRGVIGIDKAKEADLRKLKEWMYGDSDTTDATWRDTLLSKPEAERIVPWVAREKLVALNVFLSAKEADLKKLKHWMYGESDTTDPTWRDSLLGKPEEERKVPWVTREKLVALNIFFAAMKADHNGRTGKVQSKVSIIRECKRHRDEMHVKDPRRAFFCPYERCDKKIHNGLPSRRL
ncbi:hypothetical protein KVR01_012871 [Diaporthe batatas]|uniref:uncharacterized protein n=1 Tax=Diaporthe batatas TaxID=748121 RepID=UPI001D04B571|nr:uncharacterized protein KVR01_012871 [Diaporthe batatas]KAG8157163.1 hypothetical protein KVR01_012871 [Diaporthe batatas]